MWRISFKLCLSFYVCLLFVSIYRTSLFQQVYQSSTLNLCDRLQGPFVADDPQVVDILRTQFLVAPSALKYNLSRNPLYKYSKNKYSWPFIHYYIENIFRNVTNGFFVEAGALDGEYLSNSLWLEKERNFTGLLIEPDPNNYKDLLLKNRKSWTSNTCISSEVFPKKTVFVNRGRVADMPLTKKWIYHGATHEIGYSNEPMTVQFLTASTATYYSVQCFPLISYLLALNRTKIDFLSLDIQGSEMDVIKTFPFDKIDVTVIAVEQMKPQHYDKNFVHFFEERGYDVIGCAGEPDYVFIKRDQIHMVKFKRIFTCKSKLKE